MIGDSRIRRSTVVLVVAFGLVLALYLVVRPDDPAAVPADGSVVTTTVPAAPSEAPTEPEPPTSDAPDTTEESAPTTSTTTPTPSSAPTPTTATTPTATTLAPE